MNSAYDHLNKDTPLCFQATVQFAGGETLDYIPKLEVKLSPDAVAQAAIESNYGLIRLIASLSRAARNRYKDSPIANELDKIIDKNLYR